MNKKTFLFMAMALLSFVHTRAQVSIVNIQLTAYNVTPDALLAASITNSGDPEQVQLVSKLYNYNGELLLTVKSSVFQLKQGLNAPFEGNRKTGDVQYAAGKQSDYIKTTHGLPGGTFRICIDVIQVSTTETEDEFCDEIESDFNQYLYLVFPADKDIVESTTPLLSWTHSEPFDVLAQGEYYRMVVSELKDNQGPEEAITVNSPLMVKNYMVTHNFQYPFDAPELKDGGHYAWQVQKLSNGVITNKTEAWEFILKKHPDEKELKYVALKPMVDANFYTSYTGKIYFKFNEEYNTQGDITAFISDEAGKTFSVTISRDDKDPAANAVKIKRMGDNRFVLDLDKEKVKPGFYTMQIKNEKKENVYLKFYLPK